MSRKYYLPLTCCIAFFLISFLFSSCEATRHEFNKWKIENDYRNCLNAAQSEDDADECKSKYDDAMDSENERHDNIKTYQNTQKYVLQRWGYSDQEIREVAKKLKKNKNYSFDCGEVVAELIKEGYIDKIAIPIFADTLASYGLDKENPTNIVHQYYDEEYYMGKENPHCRSMFDKCISTLRIGNDTKISKKLLIEMGLLDEDEGTDEGDDEGDDDEDTPTNPDPKTPAPSEPTDTYQTEANAISQIAISKYGFNEAILSLEQKQELDGPFLCRFHHHI